MLKIIVNFITTICNNLLKYFCIFMIFLGIISMIIAVMSTNFNLEKFYQLFNPNIQILFTLYVFVITINYSLLFLPKDKMLIIKEEFDTNIKKTRNSLGFVVAYFISNFLYMIYNSFEIKPKDMVITENYSISNFASINLFNCICFIALFLFVMLFSYNLILMSQKIYDSMTETN